MFSLIMPYYDNPDMLALHYYEWERWPAHIRAEFRHIIIDDGSPTAPAHRLRLPYDCNVQVYRILEDRPWHQHGARNLGAHVASPDSWLLLTDMDHMLEAGSAEGLIYREHHTGFDPFTAYMFHRIDADTRQPTANSDGRPKPHPNSFLMSYDLYWRVGGYDENYCGIYGTDSLFRKRLPQPLGFIECPLIRYSREIVHDASTRTLLRKEDLTRIQRRDKVAAKNLPIKTLDFEWRREC